MTPDTMKELLFSLAWYDASAYHNENARRILREEYPNTDFIEALEDFVKCKTMAPGDGCPR